MASWLSAVVLAIRDLHDVTKEHQEINMAVELGLHDLEGEMRMIGNNIANYEKQAIELQELAYDIEDFVPKLSKPQALGLALTAVGANPAAGLVAYIDFFKNRAKELREEQRSQAAGSMPEASGGSGMESNSNLATELVGETKDGKPLVVAELLELLSEEDGKLRMISIVGCSGLGKTALARVVYDGIVPRRDASRPPDAFCGKAWVVASKCNDVEELLNKILQKISPEAAAAGGNQRKRLHQLLKNKRYLVVVDDLMKEGMCMDLKASFPEDSIAGSRIIVTTSLQSIATSLSPGSYKYTMRALTDDYSKELLLKHLGSQPEGMDKALKSILRKCDGSPLALVSVARHLQLALDLDSKRCKLVCEALGKDITDADKDNVLWELKRALGQCFDNLPDYSHRRCLLSASMFPQGHRVNRKSLLRKWIAERLVEEESVSVNTFAKIVDRSIIEPVLTSNNSEVKRFQMKGIILEFIVHRSISTNFVTLIHKDNRLPKKKGGYRVRRLSVHEGSEESSRFAKQTDLHAMRWLTVCNSIPFDLSKCTLLRVLDLEYCTGLDEGVLAKICKLVFLKYLSLRGSDVGQIPTEIRELKSLETLDIRETVVNKLPIEVIMMPLLAHLFGQFELVYSRTFWMDESNFSGRMNESNLETLSGLVMDNDDKCFKEIMNHARKLKKVKIYCKTTPTSSLKDLFPQRKFAGGEPLESLSIDSSHLSSAFLSVDFLDPLNCSCAIKSIKLRGALGSQPNTTFFGGNLLNTMESKLGTLEELQLFLTGLSSEDLSKLQSLHCLMYLKIKEVRDEFGDGTFVARKDGFGSLKWLCLEAPKLPLLEIKEGAMPHLTTLQLLGCPNAAAETVATAQDTAPHLGGTTETERRLGVMGISHIEKLNHVILSHSAENMEDWKIAAKMHSNRPYVKQQLEPTSHSEPTSQDAQQQAVCEEASRANQPSEANNQSSQPSGDNQQSDQTLGANQQYNQPPGANHQSRANKQSANGQHQSSNRCCFM